MHGPVVRKASKDHGLRSEASARFEKGVDPDRVREAGERAADLMAQYAGGTILAGSVELIRHQQLNQLLFRLHLIK